MGDECTLSMKVRAQALTPFPQTGDANMRSFIGNRAYTITITFGEQSAKCRHWQPSKAASIAASRIEVETKEDALKLKALVSNIRKKVPFATHWRITDRHGNTALCEVA